MEMIKKEWKAIWSNKILALSVFVLCFIPIIYAAFFLKSVWDPYGKTSDLPVAVVNEDQSANYKGETMQIGKDLVDELKKDENLGWDFVSDSAAKQGLRDQKYYMIVTIPKDFSKNATTVMDKTPQKVKVEYTTNGSLNYLGEVVSQTAMKELKASVSKKITEKYADNIFEQLDEVSDGFTKAADGSKTLSDGATKAADGSEKLAKNLKKLASSSLTFNDGEETFQVGLNKYVAGVSTVNSGVAKLKSGTSQLASKVPTLASGISKLEDGSTTLSSGLTKYTGGVGTLATGANLLAGKNTTLTAGNTTFMSTISAGAGKLATGGTDLSNGLKLLSSSIGTSITSNSANISAVEKGLTDLNTGIQTLDAALSSSSEVDTTAITGAITGIGANAGSVAASAQATLDDANAIANAVDSETEDVKNALASSSSFKSLSAADQNEILAAVKSKLVSENDIVKSKATKIASTAGTMKKSGVTIGSYASALGSGMTTISSKLQGLATIKTNVKTMATSANVLLPGANKVVTSLATGLGTIKDTLDIKIVPGAEKLDSGLATLKTGINTNSPKLSEGLAAYVAGVSKVNAGARELNKNSAKLASGATALNKGLVTLDKNVPALAKGVTALADGTSKLNDGTSKLVDNSGTLLGGITKLVDGSAQIADGSGQLADGSKTLNKGITKIANGSEKLTNKLEDGAEKVGEVKTSDKTSDMIADPVQLEQNKYSEVPNYGFALAPYVLSLALYVGCMLFNFVFPIRKIADSKKSAVAWWISKVSVGVVVAVAMALIEGGIMMLLGLTPDHVQAYFATAVVTSLSYMFLIMFLSMAFDNPGRFVAMVLLVLQLAGAGGTFPIPLSGGFFAAIHPWIPMTYSVLSFRESLCSGLGASAVTTNLSVLIAIGTVSIILLLGTMILLKKRNMDGLSQLDDNQKLLSENYKYCSEK